MMTKHRSVAGFSLVEVLVALAILAVGLLAIIRLFPLALRQARGAQERTVAAQLADSRFNMIRNEGSRTTLQYPARYNGLDPNQTEFTMPALDAMGDAYSIYDGYRTVLQRVAGGSPSIDTDAALQRVVFDVTMSDGRLERFVTYVAAQ